MFYETWSLWSNCFCEFFNHKMLVNIVFYLNLKFSLSFIHHLKLLRKTLSLYIWVSQMKLKIHMISLKLRKYRNYIKYFDIIDHSYFVCYIYYSELAWHYVRYRLFKENVCSMMNLMQIYKYIMWMYVSWRVEHKLPFSCVVASHIIIHL